MTITDMYEQEVAKAMAGETFVLPSYIAVGTVTVTTVLSSQTALTGEIGTRVSVTRNRTDDLVSYRGLRNGGDVINTSSGDAIKSIGLTSTLSGDTLMIGVPSSGITHTTDFDLDVEIKVYHSRQ